MSGIEFKECDKVQTCFSSLLEGELNPLDEKTIREHLSLCTECKRAYEQFGRTLQWLHSVGEEGVPEGFLPGIYKKMEDRKNKASMTEKARWRQFHYPFLFKIPIQAVAMLTIVILVFYFTKRMPVETPRLKEGEQPKVSLSEERKREGKGVSKDIKKEGVVQKLPLDASRVKEGETTKRLSPRGEITEKPLIPPLSTLAPMAKESASIPIKTPQEIFLRVSNRKNVLYQLHQLIKQYGGELVKEERNILWASLPAGSFREFEKELSGMGLSDKEDKRAEEKQTTKRLNDTVEGMSKEVKEEGKASVTSKDDGKRDIAIRIILLEE
jgi:hypothetical protein